MGYTDTNQAIRKHVSKEDQQTKPVETTGQVTRLIFINESGFFSLLLSSKLPFAKTFKTWICGKVLIDIRKFGYFKLFDNQCNKMILIENERDLHYKVVNLIRTYYPNALLIAGLGENQDSDFKRLDSYRKGYQAGQSDLMILNYHKKIPRVMY